MLVLLSPAKNLDFSPALQSPPLTRPDFSDDTNALIKKARSLSRPKIKNLMKLSDNLADLNYQRYQSFDTDAEPQGAKQAILAFKGDTYIGLDANSMSEEDLAFAQDRVGILSGLYGLLRPFDGIQPYRLEMGTKLATRRGKSLYDFWGSRITDEVNERESETVINLASKEYFSAVDPKALNARVITPAFKEVKDGKARMLGMFAKRARGMMTRYMIDNRIEDPEALKGFDYGGYAFMPELSTDDHWEFHRPQPAPMNK